MLPFNPFEMAGIQPWLFNGPASPLGLSDLTTPQDGPPLEPVGTMVAGRRAIYGSGGHGSPVLFLHAAGLSFRAYQRSLRRLTAQGYRVLAPSLPGFGGTAAVPPAEADLAGYAAWVAEFLDDVAVADPVFVIGHSFGAGVAVQLAHDFPERVGYLVLLDSPGTSWSTPTPLRERLAPHRSPVSWLSDAWKELVPFPRACRR
ncbi:MAG: alpha/beta fold hydrolase [Acidimicrobiales bacterium]